MESTLQRLDSMFQDFWARLVVMATTLQPTDQAQAKTYCLANYLRDMGLSIILPQPQYRTDLQPVQSAKILSSRSALAAS
ncbi:Hypothetical predicted protein, partial [Pelobates cultripes]